MKIKSLFLVPILFIVIIWYIPVNEAFSRSLKDELEKLNNRDIVKKAKKYNTSTEQLSRIEDVLRKNRLSPWKHNFFVHSCKDNHPGPECKANGVLRCVSITFVERKDIVLAIQNFFLTSTEDYLVYTARINSLKENMYLEKKAELYFSPRTMSIVKFIVKQDNQWVEIKLGKIIKI